MLIWSFYLKKINTSYNDPKKSLTIKIIIHIASRYSWFSDFLFDSTKNKLDYCRGKDCMKKFCKDLKSMQQKKLTAKKKKNDTINK